MVVQQVQYLHGSFRSNIVRLIVDLELGQKTQSRATALALTTSAKVGTDLPLDCAKMRGPSSTTSPFVWSLEKWPDRSCHPGRKWKALARRSADPAAEEPNSGSAPAASREARCPASSFRA